MTNKNYIKTNCNYCNKSITKNNNREQTNYYCDITCYRLSQKGEQRKCKTCKKEIYVPKGQLDREKFCSRKCYLVDHSIKDENGKPNNKGVCKMCKAPFIKVGSGREFCSTECANRSRRKTDSLTCTVCGCKFCSFRYTKNGTIQRPFRKTCSDKCLSKFFQIDEDRKNKISKATTGDKHPMWLGGRSGRGDGRGIQWQKARKECFRLKGDNCLMCGMSREESKEKYGCDLHIDHIRAWHYFKKDEKYLANKQGNLQPLCLSCHTKHGDKADLTTKQERRDEYDKS